MVCATGFRRVGDWVGGMDCWEWRVIGCLVGIEGRKGVICKVERQNNEGVREIGDGSGDGQVVT